MASIYAALHPIIGKRAAIKVISPSLSVNASCVERFLEEARAVNRIGHPNIVDIFSFGALPDGRSYFVMEWLQGMTLGDRLFRAPLALPETCDILDQICDALEAAHEAGVVHRDLKPDNVFLVPVRGRRTLVKLLDFGIAKLMDKERPRASSTCPDFIMGTPEYISPEQARGSNVDHRTDLYALGVLAYEMLSGQVPFAAPSAIEIIEQHLHLPPPSLRRAVPRVAPDLERIVLGLLAKEPGDRPSLAQVRECLASLRAEFVTEMMPRASRLGLLVDGFGATPRRRARLAALALVGVTCIGGAAAALRSESISPATAAALASRSLTAAAKTGIDAASRAPAPKTIRPARPADADGKDARVRPGGTGTAGTGGRAVGPRRARIAIAPEIAHGGDYVLDPFEKKIR